ncbi:MAG TPA: hypothetical protein VLA88_01215 [Candidatus Saccharimonadales bacterium]|nr:hypothetical protein [Candidatus Saccharimonadales bacterium]
MQVFAIRHSQEVRRTEAGDVILVRPSGDRWIPLEDLRGIDDVPPDERYEIILAAASAADENPRLETLPISLFPLNGKVEESGGGQIWIDADGTERFMGAVHELSTLRLDVARPEPLLLGLRRVPRNKWQRVIASIDDEGHIFGRGPAFPLAVTVYCPRLTTRHVRLVVETQLGLVVAGYLIDRTGQRTAIKTGKPLPRRLVATYDAAGKPCVVFMP